MYDFRAQGTWWILHVLSVSLFPPTTLLPPFTPPPPNQCNLSVSSVSLCAQSVYVSCCDAIRPSWSWFRVTLLYWFMQISVKSAPRGNYCAGVCLLYPVWGRTCATWVKFAFNWKHVKLAYIHELLKEKCTFLSLISLFLQMKNFQVDQKHAVLTNVKLVI